MARAGAPRPETPRDRTSVVFPTSNEMQIKLEKILCFCNHLEDSDGGPVRLASAPDVAIATHGTRRV
jgi:hypothetical protein